MARDALGLRRVVLDELLCLRHATRPIDFQSESNNSTNKTAWRPDVAALFSICGAHRAAIDPYQCRTSKNARIWRSRREPTRLICRAGKDHRHCLAITIIAATMLSTAAMAQSGPVATDCVNDIAKLCAGNRKMAACASFRETGYAKVSSDCKKALESTGGGRGKAFWQGTAK